jgi:hypothetical protein
MARLEDVLIPVALKIPADQAVEGTALRPEAAGAQSEKGVGEAAAG